MKYSLRSLMIVVTLACVTLGVVMGRVEYLGRWATYHERKSNQLRRGETAAEIFSATAYHDLMAEKYQLLAEKYRQAMWRPWTMVNELPAYLAPASYARKK